MNKKFLQFAIGVVAVWLVGMFLLVWFGAYRFNLQPDNAYGWMGYKEFLNRDFSFENVLTLWDGRWYVGLAKNGYSFDPNGQSNVAFLPLYPLLLRGMNYITHSYALAGLLINVVALVAAAYGLLRLGKLEKISESDSRRAILYFLIYPTAIFFAAVYTEALFLALAIWFFVCAKEKQWGRAALFGALAAATRLPGIFLVFPLFYYLWQTRAQWRSYLWSGVIALGTAAYLAAQYFYTGHALAFLTAQKHWGRVFGHFNPDHLYWITRAGIANSSIDVLWGIALVTSIVWVGKKLDWGYALYAAAIILIPLTSGSLLSLARFGMVLFPISLTLAKAKPHWQTVYIVVASVLLAFYTTQFVNGYWAG